MLHVAPMWDNESCILHRSQICHAIGKKGEKRRERWALIAVFFCCMSVYFGVCAHCSVVEDSAGF